MRSHWFIVGVNAGSRKPDPSRHGRSERGYPVETSEIAESPQAVTQLSADWSIQRKARRRAWPAINPG
jgi:hypothetical protein